MTQIILAIPIVQKPGFCSDGIDNDGDGNADEYDAECAILLPGNFDGAFEGTFADFCWSSIFTISICVTQWCVGSIN